MNEQTIRFRLGIFVFAALLVLSVLITLFGGLPPLFRHTNPFTVVSPTASGLQPGSPVRKSGVRIGDVRTVELDDETGKVYVGIEVDQHITLRKSDRPMLVTALLGGDAFIAF